jgi:hypothetical protein
MGKKILTLIVLLKMVYLPTTNVTRSEEAASVMNEATFLKEFSKALESKDQTKMDGLVKQTGLHIVYKIIISQSMEGIRTVAEGKEGTISFNTA